MNHPKKFYTELSYVTGVFLLALGTAFMVRADFGMSMVVAPAYLLHLKVSETFEFFTFGMAEYVLQAALILVLALIQGRLKRSHLFSFVTAVFYGFALDGMMLLVALLKYDTLAFRLLYYIAGLLLCTTGVAFLLRTYFSPEAYELFVKELSEKWKLPFSRLKTLYDCTSCIAAIIMSFAFYGLWHFEGVNWGTVVCALVNGWLIGQMGKRLDSSFEFCDGLQLRNYFEN